MPTTTFAATSASTTVEFLNGDPSNDNTNGLDNVSLVDNGPAVAGTTPEPSSIMLLGSGLPGLAWWLRRRTVYRYCPIRGARVPTGEDSSTSGDPCGDVNLSVEKGLASLYPRNKIALKAAGVRFREEA
jgi:hypothetical protein